MKTASVRDLRLHFAAVEGWLAEGEPIAITKSGKRIALLTQSAPEPPESLHSAFVKRFGTTLPRPKNPTHLSQILMDDRGL